MVEIIIRIEHNAETDKLSIALSPRDGDPSLVEKDVFLGLIPHIQSLLSQLLGQEGFRANKSDLVDKQGNAVSEDYMVANGMIEPDSGSEIIDAKTGK